MTSPFTSDEYLTYWRGEGARLDRADHRCVCIHPNHRDARNRNFQVDPNTGCATCYSKCGRTWTMLQWELDVHGHASEAEAYAAINAKIGRAPFSSAAPAWPFSFAPPPGIVPFSVRFLADRIAQFETKLTMPATALYAYLGHGSAGVLTCVKIRFAGQDAEGKKKRTFIWLAHTSRGGWSTPKKLNVLPRLYWHLDWKGVDELHLLNGEKAVDRAREQWGLTNSTCLPNGEGPKKWRREYIADLAGVERLFIAADNDPVGRDGAHFVAVQAARAGIEARVVHLSGLPPKGDLYDWIEQGHTLEEYLAAARAAAVVDAAVVTDAVDANTDMPDDPGGAPDAGNGDRPDPAAGPAPSSANRAARLSKLDIIHTSDLVEVILDADHFAADAGGKLYAYQHGVYRPDGENYLRRITKGLFLDAGRPEAWASYKAEEVIRYIVADCPRVWDEPPADVINVENGLLHVVTRVLSPHTPQHLCSVRIGATYDPAADCPACRQFGAEVFPDDALEIMFEIVAWLMTVDRNIQKAVLLVGEGANGKSVFLALVRCFLGRNNTSALSLQRMETDRFAAASLVGKLANVCADLPSEALTASTIFKAITGADAIPAEYKYKDSFSLLPFCKLIFSVNEMPQSHDSSDGFFRRWVAVPFTRKFAEGDPGTARRDVLLAKLTTPGEFSGLLNRALDALGPLRAAGRFSVSASVEEATRDLRRTTDPLAVWLDEFVIALPCAWIPQTQLRARYAAECHRTGRPIPSAKAITKAVLSLYKGVSVRQKREGEGQPWSYMGIGWLASPQDGTPPPERSDFYYGESGTEGNGRPAPAPAPVRPPVFRVGDWVAASEFTEPHPIASFSDDGRVAFFAHVKAGIPVSGLRPALKPLFTEDGDASQSVQ
jgi:putative DNA primase/helicase